MEVIFLTILILISLLILSICQKKNSWDLLAFNTILGIIALFMIGILANDMNVWTKVVSFLGLVATGSAFAAIFSCKNK